MKAIRGVPVAACAILLAVACGSSRSGFGDDPQGGGAGGPGTFNADGASGFSRDAACAGSVEPTTRAPGRVLIVLDRSFSMTEGPNGQEPRFGEKDKWESATTALRGLVDGLPDGLDLGLYMYPDPLGCDVPKSPQVALADIKVTRASIKSTLSRGPNGDTPTSQALDAGYAVLNQAKGGGAKAVIFLSDGAPNCGSSADRVQASVTGAAKSGIRTYVVGIPGSPASTFSKLAVAGGTRRAANCLEDCDRSFADLAKCCHYATESQDFEKSLAKALDDIAAKLRTTCVYKVPRPASGPFDPNRVNVLVTLEGGEVVVPRSDDPSSDSWSYTDSEGTTLVINGPLCEKILKAATSKVEIVVGCATLVK